MKKEKSIQFKLLEHSYHDKEVRDFYHKFQASHKGFTSRHKFSSLNYIHRLNRAARNYKPLNSVALPKQLQKNIEVKKSIIDPCNYINCSTRLSPIELAEQLSLYEIISFDIFDTLIFRKVAFPNDVFRIMAKMVDHEDFQNIRKKAEGYARELALTTKGCREVTLDEIYSVLEKNYGISKSFVQTEMELETELCTVNPYMKQVWDILQKKNKTIVLMSDMYLERGFIESLLNKCGYYGWKNFYLSNEKLATKGEGTLQQCILEDYPNVLPEKIIHVGDNYNSDIEKTKNCGMDTYYNEQCLLTFNEGNMENLSGTFYRSLIGRKLNSGLWDKDEFFTHGFRVGGILAAGYCQFINKIANQEEIEKILFCARDCDILHKVYNEFYYEKPNEYIYVSRYSLLNICSERYIYDIVERIILRHYDLYKNVKTLEEIFTETGYQYLVSYLDESGFDSFAYGVSTDRGKLRDFIFEHANIIIDSNSKSRDAAISYFKKIIGNSKSLLIADVGWSGSSISLLRYFIHKYIGSNIDVRGTLLATSRNDNLTGAVERGEIYPWSYSSMSNIDLARFMFPAGVRGEKLDIIHMALEYLFTSTDSSTVSYNIENNEIKIIKSQNIVPNKDEITSMQNGIIDFNKEYSEFIKKYDFTVAPYVAFNVLKAAANRNDYLYKIYGNFMYDAAPAPYITNTLKFSDLITKYVNISIPNKNDKITLEKKSKRTILFVTPELTYTGTPRSLLRMARCAQSLGFRAICITSKDGIFAKEYIDSGIEVLVIPEKDIYKKDFIQIVKQASMAVVNTIVCHEYERMISRYIPTVWYIREATNIPDFIRNNRERNFVLQHSKNIVCVSDYAKKAIQKYTKNKIRVVKNCVEDEVDLATDYNSGTGEKVKFVQFGSMEYRKGYDVLLAAYKSLPAEYKNKAELYFAGGFINSGSAFCSYLFNQMKDEPNVHYLGIVKGEPAKIETLSNMDVVTVLSRDESCSLVALEGAMLSKPLIVTENVGAKYIVENGNGFVVPNEDVAETTKAMMYFIDNKSKLKDLGNQSRKNYEKYASMDSYTKSLKKLYSVADKKNSFSFFLKKLAIKWNYSKVFHKLCTAKRLIKEKLRLYSKQNCVVSLTSHPGRIETVSKCIKSLMAQKAKPKKIILYLSLEQFPDKEKNLPKDLLMLQGKKHFEIKFVDDDLKPHKKYFYAAKEYPNLPIIIADDDVIYNPYMVWSLMKSYKKHPHCISANRVNRIAFDSNAQIRPYRFWQFGYTLIQDKPSNLLLPTGIGGVLYPPHSIPEIAFDKDIIKDTCLLCDDLWLKILTMMNGYPSVLVSSYTSYKEIPECRTTALWKKNVYGNNNDVTLNNILDFCQKQFGNKEELIKEMLKGHFC